jgi:hypothetical protein
MELTLEKKKHLHRPKLSKNMQFDAVADIYMAIYVNKMVCSRLCTTANF